MRFIIKLFLLLALIHPQLVNAADKPLPVKQNFKQSFLIGEADFRVYGLKVYHIELWSESEEFSYDKKFAIHILYKMNFKRKELVDRSMTEMKKIHSITAEEEENYRAQLRSVFHTVKKGNEKVAVFMPRGGVTMYYNNKLIGKISDPKLARYFSDLWLNEKGSYQKVTKALLGKS